MAHDFPEGDRPSKHHCRGYPVRGSKRILEVPDGEEETSKLAQGQDQRHHK